MTKGDKAKDLFLEGYTCCQAVVAAFADEPWFAESGLTLETACKLASSFGGGMGRLREVCGAVSGMFMISGLAQGFAEKKSFIRNMFGRYTAGSKKHRYDIIYKIWQNAYYRKYY
jgi:C_GCAxxG_C_C family probable redox protein